MGTNAYAWGDDHGGRSLKILDPYRLCRFCLPVLEADRAVVQARALFAPSRSQGSFSRTRRSSSEPMLARRHCRSKQGQTALRGLAGHGRGDCPRLFSGSPDQVSLVAMGDNGIRTDEDELCAIHLRNRLERRPGDQDAIRRLILAGGEVGRFHDPARPYLHPEDVDIALDIDRYNFAVRVEFENGRPVVRVEKASPKLYAANPSR
jgi:hypothetical protein